MRKLWFDSGGIGPNSIEFSGLEQNIDVGIDGPVNQSGEEEKTSVVWWKVPLEFLKFCAFRVSPVWNLSVAAAVIGFVMLGRRLYKMKRKNQSLQLKVTMDDKMYYDGAGDSQLYELRCKATRIKQGGRLIPIYFAELKAIWQELDKRRPISMACPVDIKARQDEIMKDRIYDFLAGLDDGETHVEIEGPDWFEVILEDVPAETVPTAEAETGLSPVLKDVSDPPDILERLSATPDIVIADSVDDSPSRDSIVPAHAPMDIPEIDTAVSSICESNGCSPDF
ncbi:hypothetical protein Vadar_014606 [Vaccinium darrowii]|uniref:Uncharacterized protein n=1 Tax=Vaccinium darrowii TaxID=229202 RepID=A0ACB7YWJ4_9ERIC|nr:hypothetical protein Vadar_014606 [Vaccinium darrowii]